MRGILSFAAMAFASAMSAVAIVHFVVVAATASRAGDYLTAVLAVSGSAVCWLLVAAVLCRA